MARIQKNREFLRCPLVFGVLEAEEIDRSWSKPILCFEGQNVDSGRESPRRAAARRSTRAARCQRDNSPASSRTGGDRAVSAGYQQGTSNKKETLSGRPRRTATQRPLHTQRGKARIASAHYDRKPAGVRRSSPSPNARSLPWQSANAAGNHRRITVLARTMVRRGYCAGPKRAAALRARWSTSLRHTVQRDRAN